MTSINSNENYASYLPVISEECAANILELPAEALRAWAKVSLGPLRIMTDHGPVYALRDVQAFHAWMASYERLQYVSFEPGEARLLASADRLSGAPRPRGEVRLMPQGDIEIARYREDAEEEYQEKLAQVYGGLERIPSSVARVRFDLAWYHWGTIINRVPVKKVDSATTSSPPRGAFDQTPEYGDQPSRDDM